jgi:peptide/nickel transport system substrate-binding protein
VSRDGKTYVFYLRRGVRFHRNFGEMTSADVKFSLERHLDPATASLARSDFDVIERIDTPDAYTVRIQLRQPFASFLGTLAWQPARCRSNLSEPVPSSWTAGRKARRSC